MKAIGVLTAGLLLALTLPAGAGPEAIIKERAKELVNQNNVRQGVAAPTASSPAADSPAPAPALSAAMTKLKADLVALKGQEAISPSMQQTLAQDLVAAAETGGKPSLSSAAALAADLGAGCVDMPLPAASRGRLLIELDAVLNPARYPQAKPEGIYTDIQAIFQANGVIRSKAVKIADDVKTVAAEVRRS